MGVHTSNTIAKALENINNKELNDGNNTIRRIVGSLAGGLISSCDCTAGRSRDGMA